MSRLVVRAEHLGRSLQLTCTHLIAPPEVLQLRALSLLPLKLLGVRDVVAAQQQGSEPNLLVRQTRRDEGREGRLRFDPYSVLSRRQQSDTAVQCEEGSREPATWRLE